MNKWSLGMVLVARETNITNKTIYEVENHWSCAPPMAPGTVFVDRRDPNRSFPLNMPLPSRELVLPVRERRDHAGETGRFDSDG